VQVNRIDEIAHVIQLSTAPVFLLMGVGTLLNVLSGRLARIIDRGRTIERLNIHDSPQPTALANEWCVLKRRGRLIYHAIKLSTASALLVCSVIVTLFASSMLSFSIRVIVSGLFIAAMLASIVSLSVFLREVSLAIETFEIALPPARHPTETDGAAIPA
jgi:hypothetical protein